MTVLAPPIDEVDDHVVSIVLSDWNLSVEQIKAIAAAAGAEFVRGHHVDHAIVRGAKVLGVDVLAEGGSDHAPILIRLRVAGVTLTALCWNVYVGQSPRRVKRRLRRLIKRHRPDVIALQEAYRIGDQLDALAERRACPYVLVQGPNVGEAADCALLIRGDHDLRRHGFARMAEGWIGPKHGRVKQPRVFPRGRARVAGHPHIVVRAMSAHLSTGGPTGRNRDAVNEQIEYIPTWVKKGHAA